MGHPMCVRLLSGFACPRVVAALSVLVLGGCGRSTLAVSVSCSTIVDYAVMCGTYRSGAFGGSTPEESTSECSRVLGVLNEDCRALLSDLAYCSDEAACAPDSCGTELMAFETTCVP